MILCIYGQCGTGKTTLARELQAMGVVDFVVDGDELRGLDHPGYHREGRMQNVDRAHAIALYLHAQGFTVAVSLMQPYREARLRMKEKGAWLIYMQHHYGVRREFWLEDFEEPERDEWMMMDPPADFLADRLESHLKRPRATFIGRYQTFHDGHRWLIQQALDRGDPVTVMVRDTDEPKDAHQIAREIQLEYRVKGADLRAIVVPNVLAVEYGRGVGYGIVEHEPPEDVGAISGTAIRAAQAAEQEG